MNCKTCEYFIPTFEDKGICALHDAYVSETNKCDDWNDDDEKTYWRGRR